MANAVKRNPKKMHKKAQEDVQLTGFNLIVIILTVFILVAFWRSPAYAGLKGLVLGEKYSDVKKLDNLISYINADIDDIKAKQQNGKAYPLDIDGAKYDISVRDNCNIDDKGHCKDKKTQLCLRRIDTGKDSCSDKRLNFAFNQELTQLTGENLVIKWENSKLSLYSS